MQQAHRYGPSLCAALSPINPSSIYRRRIDGKLGVHSSQMTMLLIFLDLKMLQKTALSLTNLKQSLKFVFLWGMVFLSTNHSHSIKLLLALQYVFALPSKGLPVSYLMNCPSKPSLPSLLPGLPVFAKAASVKITIASISGIRDQNSLVTLGFSAHLMVLVVFSLLRTGEKGHLMVRKHSLHAI